MRAPHLRAPTRHGGADHLCFNKKRKLNCRWGAPPGAAALIVID